MNSKYLKYAIGEIFLVVVGILIAIGINNFIQGLEEHDDRVRLTKDLIKEFESNQNQIQIVVNNQNNAIYSSFSLIDHMKRYQEAKEDSLRKWSATVGNIWTFNPQNGVLNNSIASGDILLLKSDSLKNLLFGWEGMTRDIVEEQDRLIREFPRVMQVLDRHIQTISAMEYYADKFGESKFPSNYEALMNDPQFENVLAYHSTLLMDHTEELETLKERSLLIRALLEQE